MTDAITRELVKSALAAVVDEMALTVVRTSYSGIVRDVMDFSTVLCDASGRMVAQGLTLPLHLGAFPVAMRTVLDRFGCDMGPGDVFVMNDPYSGGMHLPDVFMFKPVYLDGRLLGFPAVVAHQTDIGGRVPGGNACDSTEIYQEGLRIPPLRLYHRGRPNQTLLELIEHNVRLPEHLRGDFRAQLAALHVGERELIRLAERHTPEGLAEYGQQLLDLSERLAREEIQAWPDGVYEFTDHIDDDGVNLDVPVKISARLTIAGDRLTVDFTGTSPQVDGAINSTLASSRSAALLAIRSLMDPNIPNTEGLFRPIDVIAPVGLVVNPRSAAACAARALTCYRIVDTVLGALAQAVPHRVFAAGEGGVSTVMIGGRNEDAPFVLVDAVGCCWGGRPNKDGVDGITAISINISNTPVEIVERDYPVRVEWYGFVPDSGGAGQFRGGLALERAHRLLAERAVLQIRSDRRAYPPYGLAGGRAGMPSLTRFRSEEGERVLPSKVTMAISRGDVVIHRHAGAGGWGHPHTRDPEAVAEDLREGKLSIGVATEVYGVDIAPETLTVRRAEPAERRARARGGERR